MRNSECKGRIKADREVRNAEALMRDAECGLAEADLKASVRVEETAERAETAGSVQSRLNDNIERLACLLERINMGEYIVLLQNTRRLIVVNFACGLARGFGMILGMTALAAVFLIILSKIAALPFVPGYIAKFIVAIQSQMTK